MRHRPAPLPLPVLALAPKLTVTLAVTLGLVAPGGAAHGQGVGLPETQTIVVTAQKREQRAQNVPLSVTAITGAQLASAGIDSAAGLDQVAAGLTVGRASPGYLTLTIRGIADLDGGLLGTPATGFYIDETPLSAFTSQLPQVSYWDAERVELLRGPQGTLFGEGSMGGTVRLITNKPDANAFAARALLGHAQVAGGSRGTTARALLNVPLQAGRLALRIGASRQHLIGWVDVPELQAPDANEGRVDDARIALRWTPSPRLTVDLSQAHQRLDSREPAATSPGVYRPRAVNPDAQAPAFVSGRRSRYGLSNLTVQHDLGPATLVAALSRYERVASVRTDLTPYVPLVFGAGVTGTAERGIAALTVKATTVEWRLVSNGEAPLAWTVGAYAKEDARAQQRAGVIVSLPNDGLPLDETLYSTPARVRAQALFGHAEWRFLPKWALQGGLRHYRSENRTRVRFDTTSAIFPGFVAGEVRDSGSRAQATSPKLSLSHTPGPALLVFAGVSTGFRDGDSNYQPPGRPEVNAAYGPEKVRAFELGLKSQPWRWLTLNASVFRNDWAELQLPFVTADGLFGYIQNAGRARATGAEVEAVARPAAGLRLGLNLAALEATIDASRSNSNGADLTGKRVPFSPRLQASISASQRLELSPGLQAQLAANWSHRSATASEPTNDSRLRNPASHLIYLEAKLIAAAWEGKLYVANASNSTASLKRTAGAAGGVVELSHPQPRTVGAELSATF